MPQSTFDEDELFDEAAEELHQEVEAALEQARGEVPEADAMIETDADNVIEMLTAVSATVSSVDIAIKLEDAKKRFAIGRRADAFDEGFVDEVESELAALQEAVEVLQSIEDTATELTEAVTTFQDLPIDETGSQELETESDESSESEAADSDQQQLE